MLLSSCTVTPSLELYQYDEDGALIIPDAKQLRAVLSGYEWEISKFQFQFQALDGDIVIDHAVEEASPAMEEAREMLIYAVVRRLEPGTYLLRVRFWSPDDPRPSEWSDPFMFRKDW